MKQTHAVLVGTGTQQVLVAVSPNGTGRYRVGDFIDVTQYQFDNRYALPEMTVADDVITPSTCEKFFAEHIVAIALMRRLAARTGELVNVDDDDNLTVRELMLSITAPPISP